jgi:hypothetical protein
MTQLGSNYAFDDKHQEYDLSFYGNSGGFHFQSGLSNNIHTKQERHVSTNSFKPRKFEDVTIVDGTGLTVGHLRIKPSGVLWAPKNAKVWYGVPIKKLADFAQRVGKKQKK